MDDLSVLAMFRDAASSATAFPKENSIDCSAIVR
jgi:hypothetical protein